MLAANAHADRAARPLLGTLSCGRHTAQPDESQPLHDLRNDVRKGDEGRLLDLHPTTKPVQLIADAILDVSKRNDVILDVFLGSGTTLVAAQRTGRRCFAMELDPLYVDTAIRRWQQFGGGHATHADSGKSFDMVAQERADK